MIFGRLATNTEVLARLEVTCTPERYAVAEAWLMTEPASASACAMVYVPVHAVVAPGASELEAPEQSKLVALSSTILYGEERLVGPAFRSV